jgi:hypothetical protein
MSTVERMVEEIRTELARGEELEDIKDRSGEFIDSWLPVYNNRIIEEWTLMPNDYTDRGSAELGTGQEISIINLMTLDLYLYYSDLFAEAVQEVEDQLEQSTLEAWAEGVSK